MLQGAENREADKGVVVVTVVVVMVVVSIKFTFLCRHYSSFTTAASTASREAFVQQPPRFGQQRVVLVAEKPVLWPLIIGQQK